MNRRHFHGRIFRTLLCSILIFVFTTQAAAQSTQSPTFTIQSYPLLANNHIAVDLNGDGILDLAGAGANATAVMLGNANVTFSNQSELPGWRSDSGPCCRRLQQ